MLVPSVHPQYTLSAAPRQAKRWILVCLSSCTTKIKMSARILESGAQANKKSVISERAESFAHYPLFIAPHNGVI